MAEDVIPPELACVVLAHSDPLQLHRLIEALAPFPVYLHVDARATDEVFAALTADLPDRCTILPRIPTAWATFGAVEAEIEGYRAALERPGITHIALMSGADYLTASIDEIRDLLHAHKNDSFVVSAPLPYANWGRSGGFDRLRYRHWARGKRMLRLPLPRRLPRDVVFAGGSSSKVLAAEHARAVVDTWQAHPELVRFWRRAWAPDETFVHSILNSPRFAPGFASSHVNTLLWWINWSGARKKSPPWISEGDLTSLLERGQKGDELVPFIFARKFSSVESGAALDELDRTFGLRGETVTPRSGGRHAHLDDESRGV